MTRKNRQAMRMIPTEAWLTLVCLLGILLVAGCSSSPDQKIDKAREAYQKHDYHAAEVYLKSVLRKHPDNGTAWALLGNTSIARRAYDDAIHQFDKAQENGVPRADIALSQGRALLAKAEYKKALESFKHVDTDAKDGLRATVASFRGDAEFGLGHYDKAASAYASALSIDPDQADALLGQANLALEQGDSERAHKLLTKSLDAHPDDVASLLLLGQMAYRDQDCAHASQRLDHAIKVGHSAMTGAQQVRARTLLADCQLRSGDLESAQENTAAILDLSPNDAPGNYLQALLDIRQGKYNDAANHVQATLNARPDSLRSMTLMAWIRIAQGRTEDAQPYLTRVLNRAPDSMAALRLQTGVWMSQNRGKQALDLVKKTYQEHPEQPGLRKTLDAMQAKLKQADTKGENERDFGVFLQLDLARSLARIGSEAAAQTVVDKIQTHTDAERLAVESEKIRLALVAGDVDKAIELAKPVAENSPDSASPQILLAQTYITARRYDDAEDVLKRARKAMPDNKEIVRAQLRLAAHLGHYEQAIQELKPLHDAHPDDTGLTLSLANFYARAEQTSEQMDLLQSAVKRQPKSDALGRALARAWLAQRQPDKAMPLIAERLKTDPDNSDWLQLRGAAQLMAGKAGDAINSLERAAEQAPDNHRLSLDVAKVELSHGQPDAAITRLENLRETAPDYLPAAAFLALARANEGNMGKALAQVADLRDAGKGFVADVVEGDVMRIGKQYEKADAAYAKAYQSKPSRRLAETRFEMRRAGGLDDPAQPLEQWLAHAPDDAKAALQLAEWYQHEDRLDEAAKLYKKLLSSHPDSAAVLNNLALATAKSEPQQAIAYAKKAHEKAPGVPAIADTLGWLMVNNDQVDAGTDLLEKADEKAGDKIPEVRFHFAVALARRGEKSDKTHASRLLKEALSSGLPEAEASQARELMKQLADNADISIKTD